MNDSDIDFVLKLARALIEHKHGTVLCHSRERSILLMNGVVDALASFYDKEPTMSLVGKVRLNDNVLMFDVTSRDITRMICATRGVNYVYLDPMIDEYLEDIKSNISYIYAMKNGVFRG